MGRVPERNYYRSITRVPAVEPAWPAGR